MMKLLVENLMKALRWLTGIAFLMLFVLTILNITLRYLAGVAWLWVPDFSRLLFVWIVFTGAAVMYGEKGHLLMDYFINRMKPANREVLETVIRLSMLAFLTVLIVKGIDVTKVRMRIPFDTWEIPTGYAYAALPMNALFMALSDVKELLGSLQKRRMGNEQRG
ncbi:MAG TPA: TRAP transporter small permease [Spirochaetia bacterium]|nr:TRAP transporter small permease [Spirochaetia bacterium]